MVFSDTTVETSNLIKYTIQHFLIVDLTDMFNSILNK